MAIKSVILRRSFDSLFTPATPGVAAQLRLRLKVMLMPVDPGGRTAKDGYRYGSKNFDEGDTRTTDNVHAIKSWKKDEFRAFELNFKRAAELGWNNQIILLPPSDEGRNGLSDTDYKQFILRPGLAAHVACSLEVQIVRSGEGIVPRAIIEAVQLVFDADTARSHHFVITNRDVTHSTSYFKGIAYSQITAAHEVGHWLGPDAYAADGTFQHVDYEAARARNLPMNADEEYGLTATRSMSIMGRGPIATEYDAMPWLARIQEHTGVADGWRYIHRIRFNNGVAPVSARQTRLTGGPSMPKPPGMRRVP